MSRVYLTEAQRQKAWDDDLRKRTTLILSAMMAAKPISRRMLSEKSGVQYDALCRYIRQGKFTNSLHMARVMDVLEADDGTRAALMGSRAKCRFEKGFKLSKALAG